MPCVYWFGPAISPPDPAVHTGGASFPALDLVGLHPSSSSRWSGRPTPGCFLRVHPPAPAAWAGALFRSRGPLPAGPALPGCSRPLPPRGCSRPDALRPPPRGLRAPRARCCEGAAGGGATRNSRCPGPARSPSRASKIACAILELPPPGESEPGLRKHCGNRGGGGGGGGSGAARGRPGAGAEPPAPETQLSLLSAGDPVP